MQEEILLISERGQLTIPKRIRRQLDVKYFTCKIQDRNIILEPLQTKNEFLEELDQAEQDWKKQGGLTLKQMKKKYHL